MLFFVFSLSHTEKVWLPFDIFQEWQIDILNKKIPAVFISSAGIFHQLFHGLLHYPLLVVAQIHSHQRIQNQFRSPLRCRHSNRDSLLLYNRSMGDLAPFLCHSKHHVPYPGSRIHTHFSIPHALSNSLNVSSQITAYKPFSFFIFVFCC